MTEPPSPLSMLLFRHTKRRAFIAALGGAAAWPLAARAQQQPVPVIGFLHTASREGTMPFLAAFHRGLNDFGFVEGRNVAIESAGRKGSTSACRDGG